MEAQGGGGEVRRLHIIYFLSRQGRIEHPHLIRLHHLSCSGVRLRDVKRWISELRGKDMADSFSWSYKRRYRAGSVWQDLLDEDLITPFCDNEYVLKGSEIFSTTFTNDLCSYGDKKTPMQKEPPLDQVEAKDLKESIQEHPDTPLTDVSIKTPFEIEEESPPLSSETSTLTDDYMKLEEEMHRDTPKDEEQQHDQRENFENTSYCSTSNKNKENGNTFGNTPASSTSSASRASFTKSRSYSSGASHMFRNFISCGAVDTNDSTTVMINRQSSLSVSMNKPNSSMAEIRNGEKLGGSERISRTSRNQQQQQHSGWINEFGDKKSWDGGKGSKKNKKSEFSSQKTVSAAYKPINGPNCSQCKKQFKPEKLHSHMKSCTGMKRALAKGPCPATSAAEKTPRKSANPSCRDSISGYYLNNK